MSVHYYAAGDSVGCPQHHVRRFSRHTGQREDFIHGSRDFSVELFQDRLARAHHGLGFVAEETCRTNFLFQLAWRRISERLSIRVFLKESLGHLIHTHVRALRGKNRRDQQLERVLVIQFAGSARISFIELGENGRDALRIGPRSPRGLRSFA